MHHIRSDVIRRKTGRRDVKKRSRVSNCRGSFTVESVFLFPVIILLIAFLLNLSIDCFESVRQAAADVDTLRQMDTRTYFLNQNTLQEILKLMY